MLQIARSNLATIDAHRSFFFSVTVWTLNGVVTKFGNNELPAIRQYAYLQLQFLQVVIIMI